MSTFTARGEPRIDDDINADLDRILAALSENAVRSRAVYLIGGFGRGEGTVRHDGDRWRGVNDYDLAIFTDGSDGHGSPELAGLGPSLAQELGIDYVDLWFITPDELSSLNEPTILNHDLRHGSKLLEGEDVFRDLPDVPAADIPAYEFARLLANRAAGLLTCGLPGRSTPTYAANQRVKACIAAGDAAVYLARGYHPSYQRRADDFALLAEEAGMPMDLDPVDIETIRQAYREKIIGPSGDFFPVPSDRMRHVLEAAFCAVAERIVARPVRSMNAAERLLIRRYPDRYHRVLFAQPTFYCMRSGGLPEGAAFLKRFARVPGALRRPWNRSAAVTQWERWCH